MSRNLVISPIGDNSKHRTWINGPGSSNFDLFLIYFGDGPDFAAGDAKYYLRNKGFKWEHIHMAAEKYADKLREYDFIWCPDDDIACDTASVNELFEIMREYNLQLAQPAISAGEFAFKSLIQQPGNILRYSPYVEVMCPIFTQAAFFKLQDTFLENRSAWGLDWIWPKRFALGEMAIIDKVGIHHTGRLGKGENYKLLAKLGINPYRDFEEAVARHGGIDWNVHRRMLRGRLRMKRIRDPNDGRNMRRRISDYLHWLGQKRSAA